MATADDIGNYYVSVIDPDRRQDRVRLLSGPYPIHQMALERVTEMRRWAESIDTRAVWYAYGTVRMDDGYSKAGIYEQVAKQ